MQPLGKLILISPITEEKKGLLIVKHDQPKSYQVLEIGDEVTKVKVGDELLIEYPRTIHYQDKPYLFVNEENVVAKVKV